MAIPTNLIHTIKRPAVTAHVIDLSLLGLNKARAAQFSRLGNFLAVVPAQGAGQMFRCYNLFGDVPELKPLEMPETAPWEAVAFNPEQSEVGEKSPSPELAVACGDEIVQFVYSGLLTGWKVLRRLPMPAASCIAYSQDGQLIVAGSKHGDMKVWANCGAQPEEIQAGPVAGGCITGITVSHQNDVVYFCTANGDCFRFSGGDGPPSTLKAADERAYGLPCDWEALSLACSPTEPHLVLGGSGDMAWFMNLAGDTVSPVHTKLGGFIRKVCYLHKGSLALLGADCVELWNARTMKRTNSFPLASGKRALTVRCFINTCYVVVA